MKKLLLALILLSTTACEMGFQTMESSQHAVVFNALPRFLGGGLRERLVEPGEMEFIWPWQQLYRFDTGVQSIAWGDAGRVENKATEDLVESRALDGNEVGLAITIQYRIDPKKLQHIVQRVAEDNSNVHRLVAAVARADIRTHMNTLNTSDFFRPKKRQAAVEDVKTALNHRLSPEGIIIDAVIYNDHRFERRLADGTYDRAYQEQIDKTQAVNQQTEQEVKKIATVVAQKKQEFNEEQARVNRLIEAAEGYKRQATLKGDAYLESKKNEAEQVRVVGMSHAEGLKQQIEAMSGAGGEAILRLALYEALMKATPQFVLVDDKQGGNGLDISRVDANELIKQIGGFAVSKEALEKKPEVEK